MLFWSITLVSIIFSASFFTFKWQKYNFSPYLQHNRHTTFFGNYAAFCSALPTFLLQLSPAALGECAAKHYMVGGEEAKGLRYGGGEAVGNIYAIHTYWLRCGTVAPSVVGDQRYAMTFVTDYLLADGKLLVGIFLLHNLWNVQSSAAAEVGEDLWVEVCRGVWNNCP
jgi:hypothetical protein